jgi:tRNA nucleotidyltransferase (CCA-adding enzyme)
MNVIVSHVNADFDSLGGLVGAARLYPGAVMVLPGGQSPPVSDFLSIHREVFSPRTPAEVDPETITRVIVVDTRGRQRLGPAAAWLDLPDVEVHLYDHHPDEDADIAGAFELVRPWGSVSSILAHAVREAGELLTPAEATAMLLGIYEDTGSLSFAGTRPEDLEAAAWLLRAGGDLDVVARFTERIMSPEQRRLLAELLAGMETHTIRGVRVLVAAAPPGPYVDEAAVLVHRLLGIEEAGAAFILARMEADLYVIGRSRTDSLDVGAVLREIGGGGHARAASAKLRGEDAGRVKDRLLAALERRVTPEKTAEQIMSHPVRSISAGEEIAEAHRRMVRYGHSGLVVLEEGRLAGILSRRDVDKARHHRLEHAPVRGFMSGDVHTAAPGTPVSELERLMIAESVGRLPVVREGEVVGIVTRTDVLRALHGARYLEGAPPVAETPVSQLIRERLPARIQRLLEEVGRVAEGRGSRAYVVGGFVRDLLLDVRNLDLDLLVEPDGIALARAVAQQCGGELKVDERFGTAQVVLEDGCEVDFATARTESYAHPGALPEVEPSSVLDDLRRRDFSINAMAAALAPDCFGELLDPFGGRRDLDRRCLRLLHSLSFVEDPTRIFRAVRFEQRYRMEMDGHTEALARDAVAQDALGRISPERLLRELHYTFAGERPLGSLLRLGELGVLAWVDAGLELDEPLLRSVPGALEWWRERARDPVSSGAVWLAALLAPRGRVGARRIAEDRLRASAPELNKIESAVRAVESLEELLRPDLEAAAVTRLIAPLPPEALVLLRAAIGSKRDDEPRRELLERFVSDWRHTKLEITGEDLKALGYRPGPALGRALRKTLDARVNGQVRGREGELAYARAVLGEPVRNEA